MKKLLGTTVFCLILLLLTFGSALVISTQETIAGGVNLAGGQSGPPTKSKTSLPFGATTIDGDSVSLNVRLEDDSFGEMPSELNVSAEVHFNTDFGPEASGRIRLYRVGGEIVGSSLLKSIGLVIGCNTVPGSLGYPYHFSEQTFLMEQARLDGQLNEHDLVYADVVIVGQDGTEYGLSELQAHVTK